MISSFDRSGKMRWDLLIAGMVLLALYAVLAWAHRNFGLTDFIYIGNSGTYMSNIPTPFIRSQFWKIFLLFPATILLAVALAKRGFRFQLPAEINERLAVASLLIVAAVILVLSSQLLFQETEVTDDENTFDFQARTLLLGRITNPPPPVTKSFENVFMISDGRQWAGKYTLGHPLIIAVGMVLGNRYILTIGCSVLTLLLLYLISLRLYRDRRIALLTLILACISPFFYLVSSSRLSHTTAAFFLALFVYLFLVSRDSGDKSRRGLTLAFLAGLALGYAFNVRSLTALAYAIPFCVLAILDLRHKLPGTAGRGVMVATGFLATLVITLWYNAIITGSAFTFPFHYYDAQESLGFGVQGHTILRGFRNLAISLGRLNSAFLGFPLSLLFAPIVLFGVRGLGDNLSLGIIGSIAVAYLFYFSPGVSDLGPVYYYEAIIPLVLLSARGITEAHRFFAEHVERGAGIIPNALVLSVLLSAVTDVPEQVSHVSRLTEQIRLPYEAVRAADIHNALVFIQSWPKKGWVFGFRSPSPDLSDDVVFALYSDAQSNATLMKYLQGRRPFLLRQDTTSGRYEVMPADPSTLLPLSPQ